MSELIAFLPLIALVVSIALGFYPGEEIIARLGRRFNPRGRRPSRPWRLRPITEVSPHLGRLAASRPSRAPPRSFASH